ncbi:hypothetical protein J6Z48_01860 [bacterium]|nr:hypothetical protein [bacterium]
MIDLTQTTIDNRGDWKYWVMCRNSNCILKCTDSKRIAFARVKEAIERYKEIGNYQYHDVVIFVRNSEDDWGMIYGEDIVGLTYWDYIKYKICRIKKGKKAQAD